VASCRTCSKPFRLSSAIRVQPHNGAGSLARQPAAGMLWVWVTENAPPVTDLLHDLVQLLLPRRQRGRLVLRLRRVGLCPAVCAACKS
jgi:hypothetical protein